MPSTTATFNLSGGVTQGGIAVLAASGTIAKQSPAWNASGDLSSSGSSYSLPQATATNDCIVVAVVVGGTGGTVTVGGSGITWVQAFGLDTSAPGVFLWVGYAATSGKTSFTITYSGAAGTYAVGMFSGVQSSSSPVASASSTNGTSGSTYLTTTSLSYSIGQLIVGACAAFDNTSWSATTWSNGQATTSIGSVSGSSPGRNVAADFIIAAAAAANSAFYALM